MKHTNGVVWYRCADCAWRMYIVPLASDQGMYLHLKSFPNHTVVRTKSIVTVETFTSPIDVLKSGHDSKEAATGIAA